LRMMERLCDCDGPSMAHRVSKPEKRPPLEFQSSAGLCAKIPPSV